MPPLMMFEFLTHELTDTHTHSTQYRHMFAHDGLTCVISELPFLVSHYHIHHSRIIAYCDPILCVLLTTHASLVSGIRNVPDNSPISILVTEKQWRGRNLHFRPRLHNLFVGSVDLALLSHKSWGK